MLDEFERNGLEREKLLVWGKDKRKEKDMKIRSFRERKVIQSPPLRSIFCLFYQFVVLKYPQQISESVSGSHGKCGALYIRCRLPETTIKRFVKLGTNSCA